MVKVEFEGRRFMGEEIEQQDEIMGGVVGLQIGGIKEEG